MGLSDLLWCLLLMYRQYKKEIFFVHPVTLVLDWYCMYRLYTIHSTYITLPCTQVAIKYAVYAIEYKNMMVQS